jgi:hypothetical protein
MKIDPRYNTYATSIIFHLLHNNEEYNKLWIEKYPDIEPQATNYFKDVNCGCAPVLLQKYRKFRFDIDFLTVDFINKNPDSINLDDFCQNLGRQELRGTMFSVNKTEADFKNFVASLHKKNASFTFFNTLELEDKILVTFF